MSGYRGLAHGYRYAFRRFEAEMPKSVGVTMSICRGLAHGYRQSSYHCKPCSSPRLPE